MRNDSPSAHVDTSHKEISDDNAPPTLVPIETSIKEEENGKKTIGTGNENRDAFPEHQDTTLQEHDNTDGFSDDGHLSPTIYEYPAPQFQSFEEDRSREKFKPGQVWAMYGGSFDAFPRQYGWINKVEPEPFMVHLMWLGAYPRQFQEKCWPEQHDISISYGTFRVLNEGAKFDTTDVFSHLVDARETGVPRQLEILPRVGEVWAVYTRWIPASSIVYASEFALVEVIGRTEAGTRLSVLAKVDGYVAVFKPDKGNGVLEIPAEETSRSFSHCIPCFRLTGEEGGDELRGFYELDTASVPYSAVLSILCGQDKP